MTGDVTVTYSMNVFIPLTRTCRNNCHYCGFRINDGKVMGEDEVENLLKRASSATEALFTFGERADEFGKVRDWLRGMGFDSMIDYTVHLNKLAVEHGLLPHTNAGVLSRSELKKLKEWNASIGLMLEQAVELECHKESPGKNPEVRIKTIKDAGRLEIPFTTGILIGIGESRDDRYYSIEVIADLAENYDHIQEVIIQNFSPKKGTPMECWKAPGIAELLDAIEYAKKALPDDVVIQIPPNLIENLKACLDAGARDIGGISEVTPDYINPEHPWPSLKKIEKSLNGEYTFRERLPIHPKYVRMGWYSERIAHLIERYADKEGYRCSK
ncbi:7,8-didemethyl-8-hydroxy-5-deazariboflavin synthase subunit CofG [Geoglobus acetivorans]|nr:7,8-didemethyl-8-hydroxy-5-deazariboflavin synthase subunit CofG [Geoglobus acetivorans]